MRRRICRCKGLEELNRNLFGDVINTIRTWMGKRRGGKAGRRDEWPNCRQTNNWWRSDGVVAAVVVDAIAIAAGAVGAAVAGCSSSLESLGDDTSDTNFQIKNHLMLKSVKLNGTIVKNLHTWWLSVG